MNAQQPTERRTGRPGPYAVSRRHFLKQTAAGAAAALAGPLLTRSAPAILHKRPPNLLFLNVDQLRLSAIGRYGCQYAQTPHLDRLIQRGTSFRLSHSADPICCPARAAWMTGRAPIENGVASNNQALKLRAEMPDLGAWLRNAGYETFYVGKWHVTGREVSDSFTVLNEGHPAGEQGDWGVSRACEALLRNRPATKPLFLGVGLMNPHDICQFGHPPQHVTYPQIETQLPPLPPNFAFDPREPEYFIANLRRSQYARTRTWTQDSWRMYAWTYYRYVEMIDAHIGRILDALENSDYADNTLLVFSSDHGEAAGCHGLITKNYLYDEAVRVPMVVSFPGQVAANCLDEKNLVSGLDLAPTLCDYAGIAPPPDMRGLSLRPVLEARNAPRRDHVIAHSAIVGRMVRTARYKYIAYQGDKTDQLFDMLSDPLELRNVSAESAYAGTMADHRQMLADWEAQLKPAPTPPGGWVEKAQRRKPQSKRKTATQSE